MMTNEQFVAELDKVIKRLTETSDHPLAKSLMMECRERIDSIKDLKVELDYYKKLVEGYENILNHLKKNH
jgi:hypothetical protein